MEWKRTRFDRQQNRPFSLQKKQRQKNIQTGQKTINRVGAAGDVAFGDSATQLFTQKQERSYGTSRRHSPRMLPVTSGNPGCDHSRRDTEAMRCPLCREPGSASTRRVWLEAVLPADAERGALGGHWACLPRHGPRQLRHVLHVKSCCRSCRAELPGLSAAAVRGRLIPGGGHRPAWQQERRRPWLRSTRFRENCPLQVATPDSVCSTVESLPEVRSPLAENHEAIEKVSFKNEDNNCCVVMAY